jgi:hypothetical protein
MKHFLLVIFVLGIAVSAQATDVGVSISIGQPGFYGQIDIGTFPRPQVIYAEPVIVSPPPVHAVYQPMYLRVPPGHEKHWAKHCREYNACGRPVYFVREQWYKDVYVPEYHARNKHKTSGHGEYHGGSQGHGRGHGEK